MGAGTTGDRFILMFRDDHSSYQWLFIFSSNTAENATHTILDRCKLFGTPKTFMSDVPMIFRNETLRLLSRSLRIPHDFTVPYCTWSQLTVERLGCEILRIY